MPRGTARSKSGPGAGGEKIFGFVSVVMHEKADFDDGYLGCEMPLLNAFTHFCLCRSNSY